MVSRLWILSLKESIVAIVLGPHSTWVWPMQVGAVHSTVPLPGANAFVSFRKRGSLSEPVFNESKINPFLDLPSLNIAARYQCPLLVFPEKSGIKYNPSGFSWHTSLDRKILANLNHPCAGVQSSIIEVASVDA